MEDQGVENLPDMFVYMRDDAVVDQGDVLKINTLYYEITRINDFKPGDTLIFKEITMKEWDKYNPRT